MIDLRRALGGAVLVVVAAGVGRALGMAALAAALGIDTASDDPIVRRDGLLLVVGILTGSALGGLALAWTAAPDPRSALALERPSGRALAGWTLAALVLLGAIRGGGYLLGIPVVEAGWIDAYRTAPAPLLALALVVTSIFEELTFRGLFQTALTRTRLGTVGALLLPSLVFTAAHAPDTAFRFVDVLASALLLAAGRHATRSSLTMIPGHVLGNLAILALVSAAAR